MLVVLKSRVPPLKVGLTMSAATGTSGRVDRALYLVDRASALTTSTTTGVTTVPLVVNPNFGALLADRAPGMLFRVGLRIGR